MSDTPDGQMTEFDDQCPVDPATVDVEGRATAIVEQETFTPATPAIAGTQVGIEQVLMIAVNKGMSPEQLTVLVGLHERLQDRNARAAYHQAMAKFRVDCPSIIKGTANAQFQVTRNGTRGPSMYAAAEDITRTIDPHLARNGLSYRFDDAGSNEAQVTLRGTITHEEGHSVASEPVSRPIDNRVAEDKGASQSQRKDAAETNCRRALLKSMFGLTPMYEDDDGNSMAAPVSAEKITEEQERQLQELIEQAGGNVTRVLKFFSEQHGIAMAKLSEIPVSVYPEIVADMKRRMSKTQEKSDAL